MPARRKMPSHALNETLITARAQLVDNLRQYGRGRVSESVARRRIIALEEKIRKEMPDLDDAQIVMEMINRVRQTQREQGANI